MNPNIVEVPELNKLYLIRRNKGGSQVKRYQPGTITDIRTSTSGVKMYTVVWLYDDTTVELEDYAGLVRVLTPSWLRIEYQRSVVEATELNNIVVRLQDLLSTEAVSK